MSVLAPAPQVDAGRAARLPRGALAVVVLALVLTPLGLRPLFGPLQVSQALDLLVVGTVVVAQLLRSRVPLPLPTPLLWGGGLLVVVLLSTATSVDVGSSLKQVVALVVGLALCCAVVAVCSDARRWLAAVRALLVGGLLVCVPATLSARDLDSRLGGSVVNDRPVGIFAQPNELGAFAMMVALVALGLLLGARTRSDRLLAGLTLAGSAAALAVSLSRGAWIGAVLGGLALLVWVPRARRPVLGSAAGVVVLVGLLAVVAPSFTPVQVVVERVGSLASSEENPYDDRPLLWAEAVRETRERPLLGMGPGTYAIASVRSDSVARTVQGEHAHDVLLTAGAETGLLGVGMLVGLTLGAALAVHRGLRAARGRLPVLGPLAGLAAALTAFVGEGLVDVTLRNAVVAQTLWVVLGLALAGAAVATRGDGSARQDDGSSGR